MYKSTSSPEPSSLIAKKGKTTDSPENKRLFIFAKAESTTNKEIQDLLKEEQRQIAMADRHLPIENPFYMKVTKYS